MPRIETKAAYQELDQGWVWPVYWVYGPERLKAREFVKRLRTAVEKRQGAAFAGMATEVLEGGETSGRAVCESAQSLSLGGGTRLTIVRDAHQMADGDAVAELLGPAVKWEETPAVTVFVSRDLDQRKKLSKLMIEKAAVIDCSEVKPYEREAWVRFLAKRRGLGETVAVWLQPLLSLEPWSLEAVDQELEKLSIAKAAAPHETADELAEVLTVGAGGSDAGERFIQAFFGRDLKKSLEAAELFAHSPEEALPLLGLMAWNARQLEIWIGSKGMAATAVRGPAVERMKRWSAQWSLPEAIALQTGLAELDKGAKQSPLLGLGLWSRLAHQYCSA